MPPQLNLPSTLAAALMDAAVKSVKLSAQAVRAHRRQRRGGTLKPGTETPLWNELAAAVQAHLARYGEKARLARVLRLPRQRVHEFLRSRRHLPDAERTLLLLIWLQARNEGRDLG